MPKLKDYTATTDILVEGEAVKAGKGFKLDDETGDALVRMGRAVEGAPKAEKAEKPAKGDAGKADAGAAGGEGSTGGDAGQAGA